MNWHNLNKLVLRRIIFVLSIIMWLVLVNEVNFMGVEVVARYGEVKVFTEEWFLADITVSFVNFFTKLFAIALVLFVLSWKSFGEYSRQGIWLYNGAIGAFVLWLVGYIATSLFAIRVFSWYTILCGVVAVLFIVYLIVNVIYYGKHKEDMAEDKKVTLSLLCFGVAVVATVMFSVNFSEKYKRVWDGNYNAVCNKMESEGAELVDEEITYEDYMKLQYANYFNPEGKNFTIQEFEEAVNNYHSGEGSWYVLWYVWDSRGSESFFDYDFEDFGWDVYVKYATRELMAKGIEPEAATYEELEEACKYVYDVYAAQIVRTYIGDEAGEIVIHVEIPESRKPEDVILTYEGEGYFAVIDDWYKVEDKDENIYKRDDPVDTFEEGSTYKAYITIYPRISYSFVNRYEEVYIEYIGAESDDVGNFPIDSTWISDDICIVVD